MILYISNSDIRLTEFRLAALFRIPHGRIEPQWLRTRAIKELRGVTGERRVGVIEARAVEVGR